jgi:uncharacterized protein YjbJ (UPF0337 family)
VTLRLFEETLGELAQGRLHLGVQCASGLEQALLRHFHIGLPRFHVISIRCYCTMPTPLRTGWLLELAKTHAEIQICVAGKARRASGPQSARQDGAGFGLTAFITLAYRPMRSIQPSRGRASAWNLLFHRDLTGITHSRRFSMGSTADKVTGMTNEAVGKIKQGVGKVVGSEKLQVEGVGQQAKGGAQKAMGDAKAATKDAANKATDFVNRKL